MISDEVIRSCTNPADFAVHLREVFTSGDYEGVYDSINRFFELATANRSWARQRLWNNVVAFTSNYVIPKELRDRDPLRWAAKFPDLLEQVGELREDEWQTFLLDRATFKREGLRNAIEIIRRTIAQF